MKRILSIGGGLAALALLALTAATQAGGGNVLKVGDKLPPLTSVDENGKTWKSTDVVGKQVLVLYFYPADFTGGCTKQACGFRDDVEKLAGKKIFVAGVSGDSAETHAKFKKHHKLNFTLLADEKGDLAKKFGIPVKKGGVVNFKTEGGTVDKLVRGATIARYTVVVDLKGNIAAIDAVKDAGGDSQRILKLVAKLAG